MAVSKRQVLALLLFSFNAITAHAAQIASFFPTGSVKQVQQVTVNFSTDMIAMGDPRAKIDPFTVTCNVNVKKNELAAEAKPAAAETPQFSTRWADNKNWVLDFAKPLKAGIRCAFTVKPDAKDLAGKKVVGLDSYSFSTSGPAILEVSPHYGQIEPDQFFVLETDGAIDPKSIEAIAYFEVKQMPDKVGVNIIEGKDRDAVIEAAIKSNWRWNDYRKFLQQKPAKPISQIKEFSNFLVVSANRRFPESANVVLHWPRGILSKSGVASEDPQKFPFEVIAPFKVSFVCERLTPERPCNPILNMRLDFTKWVPLKFLADAKLVSADGSKTWIPTELTKGDGNKNVTGVLNTKPGAAVGVKLITNFEDEQVDSLTFSAPFPEMTKFKLQLPSTVRDEIGRPLVNKNKFPLSVATDEYSPLIKFPAPFGILELKADPVLPVSVRNVEKQLAIQQLAFEGKSFSLSSKAKISEIISLYVNVLRKTYAYQSRNTPLLNADQGAKFQMPKPMGTRDFELVGIPLKKPGFYVVEMASPRLGEALTGQSPMYVATAALVTDMAVHFKKGRESNLVWVTHLSTAKPVSDAKISIVDTSGKELATGKTDKDGQFKTSSIDYPCEFSADDESESQNYSNCEIFAFAQKGDDVSFVSSSWSKGIETYRYNVPTEYLSRTWGPIVMHTILDRMAAQPGEAIQMKHVLREHRENGFSMMNEKRLPKRVLIVHQGSNKTYTLPFEFDKSTGSAIGKFNIPKDATLGRYSIYLSNKSELPPVENGENDPFDYDAQATGHFIVSEYRLPLMKANIKIQGATLVQPAEVKADLSAHYLSGGPAKNMKVKLRASLQPGYYMPDVPGGNDYNFFARPTRVGISDNENHQDKDEGFLKVQDLVLNPDGGLLAFIRDLPKVNKIQQMNVEMEYIDPNGEVKTAAASAPLFPADYVIGLRSDSWYTEPGKAKVLGVITNNSGKPQSGKAYVVEAFQSNFITHRKRLVGGFYSYDSKTEVISLGKVCSGKSDELGRFNCQPAKLPPGSITLQAKTTDDKNRTTYATVSQNIYELGSSSWWVPSDSDRIDLIPEKNRFEPNEKAKLIVQSPFPTATVLVTVEREGILDSFVTEIQRDNPTIEVPLKGNYAPNVFISALVVRGRIGDPKPTALLDLARPSMKMGVTELKVGWKSHELSVTVKADKLKYRTKEKAEVSIQVKSPSGAALPAGSEVTVAAVDESLLRLKENSSWKILKEMMGQRELAVNTSSGQNQVIGRRHFGSKAKAPGGSGGNMSADPRELFDPILFWSPKIKLNAEGMAKVSVPLNDSITSFRIVAVALVGENLFGDGQTTIESSKDLIIYSGFSPLVREGDQIQNAFTLRNTTAKTMTINVNIVAKEIGNLPTIPNVELKPNEAKTLVLPVTVPNGINEISYQLQATDTVSGANDSMIAKVKVDPAVPAQVLQATLFQLDKTFQIPVKQPADALAGRGGLAVHARSSLVTGLAGVKSYMQDYGYSCLEQKISKGIVAENKKEIEKLIEAMPAYFDNQGLLKFFPVSNCGSAQLTRYVMNILNENSYAISKATKDRALAGLTSYVQGKYSCRSWWDEIVHDKYGNEAKVLALETLSRYQAFSPELLSIVQINPNLWKTETATAWFQILKRESRITNRDAQLTQVQNILKSRLNFQGSIMNLQGELDWESQWHLFSSNDQEALGLLGIAINEESWKDSVGRMARGVTGRLRKGRWDTTMANAWGVTYLRNFSAKFEKEKLSGETKVSSSDSKKTFDWRATPFGEKKLLNWPKNSEKNNSLVQFNHIGEGKPWIHFETLSAIPLKAALDLGYKISRKITAVVQATPGSWNVGDVANVELTIVAKADQPWVVIRDPVPPGSLHLGTGLDGSSELLDRTPKKAGSTEAQDWPTEYEEKSTAHFISYAAYLHRGTYRTNYRVRLNSAGVFKLPPSRVEAMYSPETFGEVPNANWIVTAK